MGFVAGGRMFVSRMPTLSVRGLSGACSGKFSTLGSIDLAIPRNNFFTLLKPGNTNGSAVVNVVDSLFGPADNDMGVFNISLLTGPSITGRCLNIIPRRFGFGVFRGMRSVLVARTNCFNVSTGRTGPHTRHLLGTLNL